MMKGQRPHQLTPCWAGCQGSCWLAESTVKCEQPATSSSNLPAAGWPAEQGFAEPKYKQYIGYYECAWILVIQLRIYIIWHSCFFIPRSVCTSTSFLCFEASLSKCLCSVSLMISFSWIPVPLVFWYPSSISISDEERMVVGASVFSHVQYKHFYLWLYGWWSIFL